MSNRGDEMPSSLVEEKVSDKKVESKKVVGKINVIATRAGFYGNSRKVAGDKFTIDGEHQLGSWMKKI